MAISVQPLDPVSRPEFAAEMAGIDLARGLSADEVAAIHDGMTRFGVLVFRDQELTDAEQVAFSRQLGPLEDAVSDLRPVEQRRIGMDLSDISNLDKDSRIMARDDRRRLFGLGNLLWHSDSSFKTVPAKYSLLSARVIPPKGGNTEFADMRAAYDALDPETKVQVHDLVCEHSQMYSRGLLGFTEFTEEERRQCVPVRQRLVRRHPVTGRLSLYLSSHIGAIVGWPVPEARAFILDLMEHATQRRFVYAHVWRPFDLVIWDNRVTMHRARRYDASQVRDMRRTTVSNEVSSLEQAPPPLAGGLAGRPVSAATA
jgi:alpha-ketoglutarate-dependent 2,4-dichlorophenoxyacetate dioxygenase